MAPTLTSAFPANLVEGLRELFELTGDVSLDELAKSFEAGLPSDRATQEEFRDRLSTRLMEAYRVSGSSLAFGLLYELNQRVFSNVIAARLRKFYFALDPQDVLQEVFFNIYRYPHRFLADKDQAFRHWASMIIRNTVYKCTRERDRELSHETHVEEMESREDQRARNPLRAAIREESAEICSRSYLLYLRMYLAAYHELSSREKQALHMVECEGEPYKAAAAALGIRLENLKMVIFRARKKILRTLDRTVSSVEAWDPKSVGGSRSSGYAGRVTKTVLVPQGSDARRKTTARGARPQGASTRRDSRGAGASRASRRPKSSGASVAHDGGCFG